MTDVDVLILGAGAAGLMCAIEAARRGRRVLVLDHARRAAEKIRISGGGRCNFTNLHCAPANFLSQNPRFCVSALKRYTQHDFLKRVEAHRIGWHEKALGQLFCDDSAQDIIDMLLGDLAAAGGRLLLETEVTAVDRPDERFSVATSRGALRAASLVVATGGPSIPKIGATGFGYDIARRFGLAVVPTRPALVPLTFSDHHRALCQRLAGVSVDATVSVEGTRFREGLLFTHRGLSGPSILQISSYWREGRPITVDLLPGTDAFAVLKAARAAHGRQDLRTALAALLPKRLAEELAGEHGLSGRLADASDKVLRKAGEAVNAWRLVPAGTEGYRTAEVTLGGVDTRELSSKTMEAARVPGLYFIGEVVDVTGHLGGFNFQWAWSSGWAAGQAV
ncbi:NAD(P)/FAD-dependent oxidoreductase [Polymorphum gilvum]|uniref:Predicted oxidoreductase with FAD/NAD(P)-binding domain n=1 Tax=Polymorphum gilvum (strain LMG 25793 / CGMCC 1.9160 / SL003B-26A1) TaxID=991905 RepID=F2J1T3_POLGS|nr:NAD(P)/FAD-dependent oxidoreductase [Polymorphum gilvum]ADZ71994.1 Predicted oxidoreductase with FAD/NAD(P)-binding domain [Polymorphum gilvum SL003B-26A1]